MRMLTFIINVKETVKKYFKMQKHLYHFWKKLKKKKKC